MRFSGVRVDEMLDAEDGRVAMIEFRNEGAIDILVATGRVDEKEPGGGKHRPDAHELFDQRYLKNAVHIGHSTGGGEVARYVAKHAQPSDRVAKAVLVAAVPPIMLKTTSNPEGLPIEVFDGFRSALAANRAQFFRDVPAGPFCGFNHDGVTVHEGVIQNWWRQGMMGGGSSSFRRRAVSSSMAVGLSSLYGRLQ